MQNFCSILIRAIVSIVYWLCNAMIEDTVLFNILYLEVILLVISWTSDQKIIDERITCNYHKSDYNVNENFPLNNGSNCAFKKAIIILVGDSVFNNKNDRGQLSLNVGANDLTNDFNLLINVKNFFQSTKQMSPSSKLVFLSIIFRKDRINTEKNATWHQRKVKELTTNRKILAT